MTEKPYAELWPEHCKTCKGWGMIEYKHGTEVYEDVCPDCAQWGICPRCGRSRWAAVEFDPGNVTYKCLECGLLDGITPGEDNGEGNNE